MVPMGRIELPTSPLPRECSATELHGPANYNISGAGEGNRTLVVSLEGFCSTIELHPRTPSTARFARRITTRRNANLVEGEGFEPSKAVPADLQSAPFDRSGTPPSRSAALYPLNTRLSNRPRQCCAMGCRLQEFGMAT